MAKKEKKQKKKDPNALSLRRVFSNTAFALGVFHRGAPLYLPLYYFWTLGNCVTDFLFSTWMLREVVNRYSRGAPATEVVTLAVVVIVINLLWGIFVEYIANLLQMRYRQRIVARLEEELFKKSAVVELGCYENPAFYDKYLQTLSNTAHRMNEVLWNIDDLLFTFFQLVFNSTLLLVIDPLLLPFALIPFLFGLVRTQANKLEKKRNDRQQAIDRRDGYVQRTFYLNEYAKEMRLSAMPTLLSGIYRDALADFGKLYREYGLRLALLQLISALSSRFTSTVAMIYAAFRTFVSRTMLLGDCLVVFNSVESLSWGLTRLNNNLADFHKNATYIEDYRYFLSYEPKIAHNETGLTAKAGELRLTNVSFTYAGADKPSLEGINLSIRPGEKIALVGHNGSGKTTLVKLLLHFYEPTEGAITLDGHDVRDYNSDSYRDAFTTVFQDYKLFSLSVAENVLLRPQEEGDDALVTEALKKSGAYEKIQSLPHGIHTTLTREFDDEGANLSGGEAQKVSLARAFTNQSPFVILDEPSSALDPIAEYTMFQNMLDACRDRTLIFVSHRLSSAVLADRVVLLDGGRIIESGSHAELLSKDGQYAALFRMQAENYQVNESTAKKEASTESEVQ